MRDHLLDLVSHTYDLGCIDLVRIVGTDAKTEIDGLAEDRSVRVVAEFANPVAEFIGTIGMPNLNKDRKSTRLNSSHIPLSRMPSSA